MIVIEVSDSRLPADVIMGGADEEEPFGIRDLGSRTSLEGIVCVIKLRTMFIYVVET